MYWCASSSGGDGELVQQQWLSILNHNKLLGLLQLVKTSHGVKILKAKYKIEPKSKLVTACDMNSDRVVFALYFQVR